MAEYKIILLICLFFIHCALVVGEGRGRFMTFLLGDEDECHSIKKGMRSNNPPDSELYNEIIESDEQPFKDGTSALHGSYCYPPSSKIDSIPTIVITRFEAVDVAKYGIDRGVVNLESGGVGKNQVCIHLKSQLGGTYKYRFTVYGYQQSADNK